MSGFPKPGSSATAGELWRHRVDSLLGENDGRGHLFDPLETILEEGPQSRRMLKAAGAAPDRVQLQAACRR